MPINYILDTKKNILKVCSEEVEIHKLSAYNCKVLQVLANNELNPMSEIHRYVHQRSRFMIYTALALFDSLGFQIEIINGAGKMSTEIWII